MLDDMGVDVIEAGFPITRKAIPGGQRDRPPLEEFGDRRPVARQSKDIDRCAEAVKFARRGAFTP